MVGSVKVVRSGLGEYLIYRRVLDFVDEFGVAADWECVEVAPQCEGWSVNPDGSQSRECSCPELAFAHAVELSYEVPA